MITIIDRKLHTVFPLISKLGLVTLTDLELHINGRYFQSCGLGLETYQHLVSVSSLEQETHQEMR